MCNIADKLPRERACRALAHSWLPGALARRLAMALPGAAALLVMAGCAQLPAFTAAQAPAPENVIASFVIPPDALGARDAQLAGVLAKAGALAARQKQPATIVVTALGQDLPYLNQAIWKGVPAQRSAAVHLENLTAGASQPYSVTIKTAQSQ